MNADGVSVFETQKKKFSRLAHERNERFGGEFFRAKIIYKELLSAEGHRHYPLREPKCLRMTPDLMLPLGTSVTYIFQLDFQCLVCWYNNLNYYAVLYYYTVLNYYTLYLCTSISTVCLQFCSMLLYSLDLIQKSIQYNITL